MGTIDTFYELATRKLKADSETVTLFTKHPGTVGAFREARLRAYLKDHVGRRFHVGQGFISFHTTRGEDISDSSSLQIDCLVYDPLDRPVLFETADFACVDPSATAAAIEVKSTLSIYRKRTSAGSEDFPFSDEKGRYRWSGSLVDALNNVAAAISVMEAAGRPRREYFAGILAYEGPNLNLFQQALESGELLKQLEIMDLDQLPDCVCVLGQEWWSFEAYPWNDVDPEVDAINYDPENSFWIRVAETDDGTPLRFFTSYLSGVLDRWRGGTSEDSMGLRSGGGVLPELHNVRFHLANRRNTSQPDPATLEVSRLLKAVKRQG